VTTRVILGATITLVGLGLAGRRMLWLARVVRSGAPAPGRLDGAGARLLAEVIEVIGQRKLFKRWRSGIPHALVFWGFLILLFTIIEAYGNTFVSEDFAVPLIGHSDALGFVEDLFTVLVLAGLTVFVITRVVESPGRGGRTSRFYGSHTRAAWITLGMIAAVMVTCWATARPR
jgi:hypothetical protein